MTAAQLVSFAAPPLVGAFIGYVTNSIAIRMLFRPLQPWRLFGVKLPLTPGVLPSQRGEFAKRVGRMVGTHLLSPEDVGRALQDPVFQHELRGAVTDRLEEWRQRSFVGKFSALVPAMARDQLVELIAAQLADLLQREVPPLLELVDVERIVTEKVNSLDLLAMERLLLDVMEEHFTAINWFGALLGFLIGLVNVVLPRIF